MAITMRRSTILRGLESIKVKHAQACVIAVASCEKVVSHLRGASIGFNLRNVAFSSCLRVIISHLFACPFVHTLCSFHYFLVSYSNKPSFKMPKSAKKSAPKVDTVSAVVAKSPTKTGKRDAEEIVEKQVASDKKQKIANGGAVHVAVGKKNKNKKTKKQENNSSKEEEKVVEPTVVKEASDNNAGPASVEEEPAKPAAAAENGAVDEPESVEEEPTKPAAAAENGAVDEPESVEEDAKAAKPAANVEEDSGSEDEAKTEKKDDADAEMADAPSAKKESQATGSKTLFMGNLSFSIEKSDVINFFKDVAEVAEVRFSMRDDRFAGYGHADFATPEAALKALELNGEQLLGRAVKLDLAKERGTYTPYNGDRSSQQRGQAQGLTVFVKGFGTADGFETVRSTLEEHFGQCGEITRMSIPKDFESGGPKGVAFIDFTDSNAFKKALELSGSEVNGGTVTVEEAKQRGGGGGGGGGFGRGRGGRFGGRGGGRGRGRGGRGRGRR
ncbi:hypothetical protein QVD17_03855 [Tagetes erecta]|uniref:RRM domain-containing protein n=1 Tax=Tagetes erecta TaxID=13708 RepID=A0AAD8LAR9_TARER|nr:hypothetical protein QVD17_03855 [Tagetes erecta]